MLAIPPAGLVVEGVVTDQDGNPVHDYEGWLREPVNRSEVFPLKTEYEPFHASVEETHSEADTVTERYGIDFKFVAGRPMPRALRETSPQRTVAGGSAFANKGGKTYSLAGIKLHIIPCSIIQVELQSNEERRGR